MIRNSVAVCLLSAAALFGQNPASVNINAPSIRLVAGDSMQLTPLLFDGKGQPIATSPTIAWSVDDSSVASISSSGMLTARSLGVVIVTLSAGVVNHKAIFQVLPDHVEISPTSAQVQIGEQVQFTATAFDKNGKPIPGVPFSWAVTSNTDDGKSSNPYGTISSTGLLTGAYEGQAYVRAMFSYVWTTGQISGMENRIPVYAPFTTSAPRPFQVKRLWNASQSPSTSGKLRAKPSLLWVLPDGRLLFNASIDGVSTALLAYDGSSFTPVLSTGTPGNSAGSIVTDLMRHSVAASGTLLSNQGSTDGGMVQIGPIDSLQPLLVTNTSAGGMENLNGFNLSRNSVTSGGHFAFTGYFHVPGTNLSAGGLFRGQGGFVDELLFSQLDTLPEIGFSNVQVSDFGIDDNGNAWYIANAPGKAALYRHDSSQRTRIIGVGDKLLGGQVNYLGGPRNSSPGHLFAENGDAFVTLNMSNGNFLLKYSGADYSSPVKSQQFDSGVGVLDYSPSFGALVWANPHQNKGDGAWIWKADGSLQQVVLINKTNVNGSPVQSIESGAFDQQGNAILMVATAANPMVVIRVNPGDAPSVLFQAGDSINGAVPQFAANFITGARNGRPYVLAGSATNASIGQWMDGSIQPLLSLGDSLGNGTYFGGTNPYASAVRTTNGDLYAILGNTGVGRYRDGQWTNVLPPSMKQSDGATTYSPYRISVNDSGAIAWYAGSDKGDQRVYLSQSGQPPQLVCSNGTVPTPASNIDGKNVFNCDDVTVDNNNHVLLRVRFQNDAQVWLYAWNNGAYTKVLHATETPVSGRVAQYFGNVRVSGGRSLILVNTDSGSNIVEWTDAGLNVLYNPASVLATGALFNYATLMEPLGNGDLVFVSSMYPSFGVFSLRNGALSTVLTTGRRTDDGDLLVNLIALDPREDGTIYILAINEQDELVLYAAAPTA